MVDVKLKIPNPYLMPGLPRLRQQIDVRDLPELFRLCCSVFGQDVSVVRQRVRTDEAMHPVLAYCYLARVLSRGGIQYREIANVINRTPDSARKHFNTASDMSSVQKDFQGKLGIVRYQMRID